MDNCITLRFIISSFPFQQKLPFFSNDPKNTGQPLSSSLSKNLSIKYPGISKRKVPCPRPSSPKIPLVNSVYHCVIDSVTSLRAKLKHYVTQIKSALSYVPVCLHLRIGWERCLLAASGDLQNDGKERGTSHAGGWLELDQNGRDRGLGTRALGLRASAAVIRLVYCVCKQSRSEIYFWGFCFVRRECVLGW